MDIKKLVHGMDNLVAQGKMVDAVKAYYADNTKTSDYGNVATSTREGMVQKMEGFIGSIAKVNGITHHHSIADGYVSASEFTFDFDMKDGSKIYWHEIIRRVWNEEGKVVAEEYFDALNEK